MKYSPSPNDYNKKIKSLLLQGWRNRWNAFQFAIFLKQQIPIIPTSGDNYDLSKLILQQATVGRQPITLFLDYLHYLLSCGVVSYGSVIKNIVEICKFENTQIGICLLDFLLSMENKISCTSGEQDCLNLSVYLSSLIQFLFNCMKFNLQRLFHLSSQNNNRQLGSFNQINQSNLSQTLGYQHEQSIEKCVQMLTLIRKNSFLFSMMFVGFIEQYQNENLKQICFLDVLDLVEKNIKICGNKNLVNYQKNLNLFIKYVNEFNPIFQAKNQLKGEYQSCLYKKRINNETKSFNNDDNEKNKKPQEILDSVVNIDFTNYYLSSLNCVIAFDAILNPTASPYQLAYQLYKIAISNNINFSYVCCELIKCAFVGFADSLDPDCSNNQKNIFDVQNQFLNQFDKRIVNSTGKENVRWACFTYFKIPLIIQNFKTIVKEKKSYEFNLESGLERLLMFTPLMELIDYKSNCDCLEYLLKEFFKINLINEQFLNNILKKKNEKINYFNLANMKNDKNEIKRPTLKPMENVVMTQGSVLTMRAEPTVCSILKTLSVETTKSADTLLQVLSQIITFKSIEIVLNTLTYTGKLKTFIRSLIYINENNRASLGENLKQALLRSYLFDISFLILFYVLQDYGQEVIFSCLEEDEKTKNGDEMEIDKINDKQQIDNKDSSLTNSFFFKFCKDFIPESFSKVNFEEKFYTGLDPKKVELLLNQFYLEKDFDLQLVKWNELILNSIGAFREVLIAYLDNVNNFDKVCLFLKNSIKKNCSIGLMISFYLTNYLSLAESETKKKISPILNYIQDSNNFSFCFNNQPDNPISYYKERYSLTCIIIKNLQKSLISKKIFDQNQQNLEIYKLNDIKNIELFNVLSSTFNYTIKKNWLNYNAIYCFDKILYVGGSKWFMSKLVHLLLYECKTEDLLIATDLIFGLSLLNLDQCSLALLNIVIPQILVNFQDQYILTEPKIVALAKLVSAVIYSTLEDCDILEDNLKNVQNNSKVIKRNSLYYIKDNFIDYEDSTSKTPTKQAFNNDSLSNSFNNQNNDFIFNKNLTNYLQNKSHNNYKQKKIIIDSIAKLLRLICSLLHYETVSQRSSFALAFLKQLVLMCCDTEPSSKLDKKNLDNEKLILELNSVSNDVCKLISPCLNNNIKNILQYLSFSTITNLIKIFPNNITYDFLLSICNLQTSESRSFTAKSLCQLSKTILQQSFYK